MATCRLAGRDAATDIDFQIDVENRAYHHLSQSEIAGAKRISQHLSGDTSSTSPIARQVTHSLNRRNVEAREEFRFIVFPNEIFERHDL
jgi:hypothetical protein